MTFLPLIVRRTIIDQWAEELEYLPVGRQGKMSLRVNDSFCALGLFADLCTQNLPQFSWCLCDYFQYDRLDHDLVSQATYAIQREWEPGLDTKGLPYELCWILGFSEMETAVVSSWNDTGIPFSEIARRLRTFYVGDDPPMSGRQSCWRIVQSTLPDRNRDPDYLEHASNLSAWNPHEHLRLRSTTESLTA